MKILIIEDESIIALGIKSFLEKESYLCEWASSYEKAETKLISHQYDCILLDISLPKGNGFELLKIAKKNNPNLSVIIVSANNNVDFMVKGLDMGADDYLVKPFRYPELLARIKAVTRRVLFDKKDLMVFDEIKVDIHARCVIVNENPIDLTRKEFDLLVYLMGNKNRVLSKDYIAEHLSGDDAESFDNYEFIYGHIKKLRKKLSNAGARNVVQTVYGVGYKWCLQAE